MKRPRNIALAKYMDIFGHWPNAEFDWTDRKPHPAVWEYTLNRYKRYKIAKRKAMSNA